MTPTESYDHEVPEKQSWRIWLNQSAPDRDKIQQSQGAIH